MKKTLAPKKKTPSPAVQTKPHDKVDDQAGNPGLVFTGAVLDMSWRLAIVVLLPAIGGFELDKKLHTAPLLTIVGLILAVAGMVVVVWRQIRLVNQLSPADIKGPRS
jgi:F0F1-type ATP synthase assembly protein I